MRSHRDVIDATPPELKHVLVNKATRMSHRMNRFTVAKGAAIANHWKKVTWSASPNWDSIAPCSTRLDPVPVMVAVPPIEEEKAIPRSIAQAR